MMGRLKLTCLKIIYKLILVSHPYNKTINHFIHHMCFIFKNVMVTNQYFFGDNATIFKVLNHEGKHVLHHWNGFKMFTSKRFFWVIIYTFRKARTFIMKRHV
jgi:hypothetical protein